MDLELVPKFGFDLTRLNIYLYPFWVLNLNLLFFPSVFSAFQKFSFKIKVLPFFWNTNSKYSTLNFLFFTCHCNGSRSFHRSSNANNFKCKCSMSSSLLYQIKWISCLRFKYYSPLLHTTLPFHYTSSIFSIWGCF